MDRIPLIHSFAIPELFIIRSLNSLKAFGRYVRQIGLNQVDQVMTSCRAADSKPVSGLTDSGHCPIEEVTVSAVTVQRYPY